MAGEQQATLRGLRRGHGGTDPGQLGGLVVGRGHEVTTDDEQVAALVQLGRRRPRLDEGGHALDRVEPTDREGHREVAPLGREHGEQVVEVGECRGRCRPGCPMPATVDAARSMPAELHALGDDRRPDRWIGDVDTQQGGQVGCEGRPWEEHEVVGAGGEVAQQPVPEHEVLRQVGVPEVLAAEGPGGLPGLDQGVRVGSEGEDGGDAQVSGGLGRRQRTDVGHPQVHEVDGLRSAQDATDAASRRHP